MNREILKFLTMVEDFGTMSGGPFRQKYPDQDTFEGYDYVLRKVRALKNRLWKGEEDPQP